MKKLTLIITLAIVVVSLAITEKVSAAGIEGIVYQNSSAFCEQTMTDLQKKIFQIEFEKRKLSLKNPAPDGYKAIEMYINVIEKETSIRIEATILVKDNYFIGIIEANRRDFSGDYFSLVKSAAVDAMTKMKSAPCYCPCSSEED